MLLLLFIVKLSCADHCQELCALLEIQSTRRLQLEKNEEEKISKCDDIIVMFIDKRD